MADNDYGALCARLQRSLNQVSDSDRLARVQGLDALHAALVKHPSPATARYVRDELSERIVSGLEDPVEKCRVKWVKLAAGLWTLDATLASRLLAGLVARQPSEPSEELRLALWELCECLVASAEDGVEAVAGAAVGGLRDRYADAARACAAVIGVLAERHPSALRAHGPELLEASVALVGHPHAKTRAMAVQCLARVTAATGADVKTKRELVVPALGSAAADRSTTVRARVAEALGAITEVAIAPAVVAALVELQPTTPAAVVALEQFDATALFDAVFDEIKPRCAHWTADVRRRGATALESLVRISGADHASYALADALASLCSDDDAGVAAQGRAAAATTSMRHPQVEAVLCRRLAGDEDGAGAGAASYRAKALTALAAFAIVNDPARLAESLAAHAELCVDEGAPLEGIAELASTLPLKRNESLAVAALLGGSIPDGLSDLAPNLARRAASSRPLLEALVRGAPDACRPLFHGPLGTALLDVPSEPRPKVASLALLHVLCASGPLDDDSSRRIADVLAPHLAWAAGKTALTTRKAALAVLLTLLPQHAHLVVPLLPVLRTNLDDSDASSRRLACACLATAFKGLECLPSNDNDTYAALLKRLDDSHDDLRLATAKLLPDFFRLAPLRSTPRDYTADQLLIHLDDPDRTIQNAVFDALLALDRGQTPSFLEPKIVAARPSHRDPCLCDDLLARLSSKDAA